MATSPSNARPPLTPHAGAPVAFPAEARPSWLWLAILGALAATLLLLLTSRTGLGLSPDSASYLAAARGVAAGRGYVDTDGLPYVQWPPLFPTVVSSFSAAGLDELTATRLLQAGLFAITVAVYGSWLWRATRRRWVGLTGAALLLVSPWVLFAFCHLLSDPLFVTWTVVFLAVSWRVLEEPTTPRIVVLAVVVGLGCLTRYLGVSLLLCGAGVILVARGRSLAWKLGHAAAYGALAVLPVGLWLARNRACCRTLTGERFNTIDTLSSIGQAIGEHVGEAFAPSKVVHVLPGPMLLILVLAGCALIAIAWLAARRRGTADARWDVAGLSAGFLGVYLALLATMATISAVDPIGPRLLAPAAPALIALVVIGLTLAVQAPTRGGRLGRAALLGAALSFTLLSLSQSADIWPRITGRDRLRRLALRSSPVMPLLKAQPPDTFIVSNDPGIVYLFSGRDAGYSPRRTRYRTSQTIADQEVRQLHDRLRGRRGVLVWFAHSLGTDMIPPAALTGVQLQPLSTHPEATVYEMRAPAAP